jgi:chaperonin GroEL
MANECGIALSRVSERISLPPANRSRVGRVRESKDENFGFNAETGEFGDLVKAGVSDPAKVTRLPLQNAASIVSLMLTTEVLIADIKEEETMAAAGGGHGGAY